MGNRVYEGATVQQSRSIKVLKGKPRAAAKPPRK